MNVKNISLNLLLLTSLFGGSVAFAADNNTVQTEENQAQNCPICLNEMNDDVVEIPCSNKHIFHQTCVNTWFETNNTCPLCRQPVAGVEAPQSQNSIEEQERTRRMIQAAEDLNIPYGSEITTEQRNQILARVEEITLQEEQEVLEAARSFVNTCNKISLTNKVRHLAGLSSVALTSYLLAKYQPIDQSFVSANALLNIAITSPALWRVANSNRASLGNRRYSLSKTVVDCAKIGGISILAGAGAHLYMKAGAALLSNVARKLW